MTSAVLDILSVAALLFGLFFMLTGALGVWRLPDVYNRMHAASMCVTLGISGMLLAAVVHFARVEPIPAPVPPPADADVQPRADAVETGSDAAAAATKACLVIIFQFVAAPVGAHMLARAAHLDRALASHESPGDELAEDEVRARAVHRSQ